MIKPFSELVKYPNRNPRQTPMTIMASVKLPIDPRPNFGLISDIYSGTEWKERAIAAPYKSLPVIKEPKPMPFFQDKSPDKLSRRAPIKKKRADSRISSFFGILLPKKRRKQKVIAAPIEDPAAIRPVSPALFATTTR